MRTRFFFGKMCGNKSMKKILKPILVLGGGCHAKVVVDALLMQDCEVLGVLDPHPKNADILGIPVLGGDECITQYSPESVLLVNGVGATRSNRDRASLYKRFKEMGYHFASVIHPSAQVSRNVRLDEGVQVMAGSVVQVGCHLGENSIVNTRASVDHDCIIAPHVHLAPGVVLSGAVKVGRWSHVGTGASVIQNIVIGEDVLIGAGAVVIRNVEDSVTMVGVPARAMPKQ